MFTGIVQDVGRIAAIDKGGDWVVKITTSLPLENTAIGASMACNGICLTIIEKGLNEFTVQVSMETLSKTNAVHWHQGTPVNLEPALRMGDELGGHLLSGHVDGVARVVSRMKEQDSVRYVFEIPKEFRAFIVPKGSIAINGVSLTVNEVDDVRFDVNIIPHTQQKTTLSALAAGDEVNFEIDMIARYIQRILNFKDITS